MQTKAVVVVLVLISATCEAFFDTDFILQRAKRQTNTHSELRTLRCIGSCVSEFNETIHTMKKLQSETFIHDELLNKPKLDLFCRNYERMDSCMTDCEASSSAVYHALEQMFELFNILCKTRYEEFVSYLPCFSKSKRLVKERCVGGCGDADSKVFSTANAHLGNLCDFMSCHQLCQTRVLKETCPGETGENAGKFMVTFAEQAIKAATTALKMIAPQIILPEDCLTREGPFPSLNQADEREEDNEEDEDNFFF